MSAVQKKGVLLLEVETPTGVVIAAPTR